MTAPSEFRDLTVDHVEFYVADAATSACDLVLRYGFTAVGARDVPGDHRSVLLRQGPSVFVLTEGRDDDHPATLYVQRHGDGVGNIAMRTPDAVGALRAAVARGGRVVAEPAAQDGFVTSAIGAFGDVTHTFVQRPAGAGDGALPGFTGEAPVEVPGADRPLPLPLLTGVDHFAVCLEPGTLGTTVDYYTDVLAFEVTFEERIAVGTQAMFSKVVQSPCRGVTFTLIEPDTSGSTGQIDDFLKEHDGAGVQHIALGSEDIVASIGALMSRGVEFLATPGAYYDLLGRRLDLSRYDVEQLRARGILVDEDHDGQLFQIFARSTHPRRTFFFEVIERLGARTFGSGNIKALYEAVEAERIKTQGQL
ncbi:4-hydroxyphenylpyruvate dioxygenase [Micromonospora sp. NPDC007271]|uniref:4-hydroxyphenylpyruvate dioxygenase n=1 Tax=Micromonospora sp. NPDC007271 TaxID=3154587 RepID=UPI0033FBBADD